MVKMVMAQVMSKVMSKVMVQANMAVQVMPKMVPVSKVVVAMGRQRGHRPRCTASGAGDLRTPRQPLCRQRGENLGVGRSCIGIGSPCGGEHQAEHKAGGNTGGEPAARKGLNQIRPPHPGVVAAP